MAPTTATETVMPKSSGERWKVCVRARVVPEITAVSKPKRRPPSEATTVLRSRYELSFMLLWWPPFGREMPSRILSFIGAREKEY